MAKEFYDWVKLALDNKWLVMLCFTGVSSLLTNANQYMTNSDLETQKIKAVHEVTKGFQSVMEEIELERKPIKVVKSSCGECSILLKSHIKEYH